MKRKSFEGLDCPVALSLERVGEWWNMLILRDALQGTTRFEDFRLSLGISPTMLTRKLASLVASGLLERRLYSEKPPRHDYILTAAGRDFGPVVVAMFAWGKRHFQEPADGTSLVDTETGAFADPVLVDRASGKPIANPHFRFVPGRGASPTTIRRLSGRDAHR
jgi:DNA-binding HxlR family transcriptional regulator